MRWAGLWLPGFADFLQGYFLVLGPFTMHCAARPPEYSDALHRVSERLASF
jgi:hypothetical protein